MTQSSAENQESIILRMHSAALEQLNANVMIADSTNTIVYMNTAVKQLFKKNEEKVRESLPSFNADTLIGTNMDVFHKNPSHQQGVISNLQTSRSDVATLAGISFRITTNPLLDDNNIRIGTAVEWQDITLELEAERIAADNARIRNALDSAGSNIMLADEKNTIIYINESVRKMFKSAEAQIRQQLPNFDADNLVGANMDVFHKNPSHQKSVVGNLASSSSTEAKVAGLTYVITVNPLLDTDGSRLGTVVEWKDRTEEIAVENEVQEVLSRVAQGDLTRLIEGNYTGFFGNLKTHVNTTVEKLVEIVQNIKHTTASVATGADKMSKGSLNLSQRTEQQASSLEETSATMEEMTSTVAQNADNARGADDLAQSAKDKAKVGGDVVHKAITAMAEINNSSKRISDIIGVIDEIAFQTNLLALNASVEAARAGDQGRGFAVVASEVRNLAGRSATAAKEIKTLIQDSVTKVEQGSDLVDETGKTLEEIIDSVNNVSQMVAGISAANKEQAVGIEEVNKAIASMDQVTQENAALVEQSNSTSAALVDQAKELDAQVSYFRVDHLPSNVASFSSEGRHAIRH